MKNQSNDVKFAFDKTLYYGEIFSDYSIMKPLGRLFYFYPELVKTDEVESCWKTLDASKRIGRFDCIDGKFTIEHSYFEEIKSNPRHKCSCRVDFGRILYGYEIPFGKEKMIIHKPFHHSDPREWVVSNKHMVRSFQAWISEIDVLKEETIFS